MRSTLFMSLGLILAPGCSDNSPPPTAGGKPVAHWLAAAGDRDPKVRVEAVKKLGNVGSKDRAALTAVFAALNDPESAVRKKAIFAVVRNRAAAGPALPILARMKTDDPDPEIRQLAQESHSNLTK